MYLNTPPWDTNVSPPELLSVIETMTPGCALDIGCGTATNVITLAERGWKVTGIDFIRKPVEHGRKKAKAAGVEVNLVVGDVTRLALPGKFDLILDMGCFHNLSIRGRQRYAQSIQNWLNPGGIYLLYGFLKPDGLKNNRGISTSDMDYFGQFLTLQSRKDGTDRQRRSSWLIYKKADHTSSL
jgi:cyclopropane fatty-acyl-phospholipid synthase-like methyltransferase